MTEPRIYIETTIPSFYCEARTDPEAVARRNWTRHWWDFKREGNDVVTGAAVLDELKDGDYPTKEEALALLERMPVLAVVPDVMEIVETYIRQSVMPCDPSGDALHLAIASYYKCDLLLTWNCKHLANANKFPHIRIVNTMMGLYVPSIVTPLELLEEGA